MSMGQCVVGRKGFRLWEMEGLGSKQQEYIYVV